MAPRLSRPGIVVATLLWANPRNPYVWIVLAVTLGFGFVGFYDDYLKVTKQTHSGFAGRIRLAIEGVIAQLFFLDLDPPDAVFAGLRDIAAKGGVA